MAGVPRRVARIALPGALRALRLERRPNAIRPWFTDPDFTAAYRRASGRTRLGPERCYVLAQLLAHTRALPGAFAEVGVCRGGTAYLISRLTQQGCIHLFDTFAGMPAVDPGRGRHQPGDFADTSLAAVQALVGRGDRIRFHPGIFTASAAGLESEGFRFVDVDCDIYASARTCCAWCYPRLCAGGVPLPTAQVLVTKLPASAQTRVAA